MKLNGSLSVGLAESVTLGYAQGQPCDVELLEVGLCFRSLVVPRTGRHTPEQVGALYCCTCSACVDKGAMRHSAALGHCTAVHAVPAATADLTIHGSRLIKYMYI